MGAIREVLVPDIGDFSDIPVIEIVVKPGDRVKPEDALIVLESDKATLDVPAPFAGAVTKLKVRVGDRVSEGTAILELEAEEVAAEEAPAEQAAPEAARSEQVSATSGRAAPGAAPPASLPHASPAIRRFARELGVELDQVAGTGPAQRILKDDIQAFVRAALAGSAAAPGTAGSVPHPATHFDEADVTELEAFCSEIAAPMVDQAVEVTLTAFVLKAVAAALKAFPDLNAMVEGGAVVRQEGCHCGLTLASTRGRIVCVIRDVDLKGVVDLARESGELIAQAGNGAGDGANARVAFTLTSLADSAGTAFTPTIHAPGVAALGITRAQSRLVERDGKAATRRLLPLCLSYDSNVIDPGVAARFTGHLAALLADLRRVSL